MDDSIRQEYQRRLDAGDKEGALSYLRMLRTQNDDPTMRSALQQAIDSIEGGGSTGDGQAQASSGYGGSAGPFGDNPDAWASSHAPHSQAPTSAAAGGSFGDSGSGFVPAAGGVGSDTGSAPAPAAPATPAAPTPAPGHENAGDQIGHFIGERVHQGLSNIGLAPHEQHPANPAPPKTEHHGLFGLGHKDEAKKDDTGTGV